ncbi:HD-GYP domain-containing protein [Lutimonas sp.]|uniref:HD-GYP domain-containing protein n=1 Tax=Lutimonas sp. TaxID=1872403 RepID=UPI003D9BF7D9
MQIELVKTPIKDLKLGMFVSKLDRPWLDTPFILQGFPVKTKSDINAIKKYCSYVYIDVEKQIEIEEKESVESNQSKEKSESIKEDFLNSFNTSILSYKDKISFTDELPNANKALTESNKIIHDVMGELKKSGKLKLSSVKKSTKTLMDSVLRNSDAITWLSLMKQKDDYIYRHSVSSSIYAFLLGRHLGYDQQELQMLGLGAMLLDIGKTKIPDELLNKAEVLTESETSLMRKHVDFGLEVLNQTAEVSPIVRSMLETHHERHDGTGYPKGLAGESIPMFGRIAGIVDSFGAMTSQRPYAQQMSTYDCLRAFNQLSDKLFQKQLVEQFIQAIGFFPTGTLVELNNESVGVVVRQNSSSKLKPDVIIILDKNKNFKDEFVTISLEERKSLWINKGLEPGSYDIDPTEYFLIEEN